jgi:hypothetical protein
MHLAQSRDGDPRTGAGGNAVVHQDDRSSGNVQRGQAAAKSLFATLEFAGLVLCHLLHFLGRDANGFHNVFIQDLHASAGDGAEGEFLLSGNAELSQNKDIERDTEPCGNFGGDRHASAGNTKDDYIRAVCVVEELFRQLLAGFEPVFEVHVGKLIPFSRLIACEPRRRR